MRKMKLETVLNNLEKVQRDVETHSFDFGETVSESTTEEHDKVLKIKDVMNKIHNDIATKEKHAAEAEMVDLVRSLFEKTGGDVAEVREILSRAAESDSHESKPADAETSDDNGEISSGDSYNY